MEENMVKSMSITKTGTSSCANAWMIGTAKAGTEDVGAASNDMAGEAVES
jgi:hypothetical protein